MPAGDLAHPNPGGGGIGRAAAGRRTCPVALIAEQRPGDQGRGVRASIGGASWAPALGGRRHAGDRTGGPTPRSSPRAATAGDLAHPNPGGGGVGRAAAGRRACPVALVAEQRPGDQGRGVRASIGGASWAPALGGRRHAGDRTGGPTPARHRAPRRRAISPTRTQAAAESASPQPVVARARSVESLNSGPVTRVAACEHSSGGVRGHPHLARAPERRGSDRRSNRRPARCTAPAEIRFAMAVGDLQPTRTQAAAESAVRSRSSHVPSSVESLNSGPVTRVATRASIGGASWAPALGGRRHAGDRTGGPTPARHRAP